MTPRALVFSLALAAVAGLAVLAGGVPGSRGGGSDAAVVAQARAVCGAQSAGRSREALSLSRSLPSSLASEAGQQVVECHCWALRSLGEEASCSALLDTRLAPTSSEPGAGWIPPPTLVRPVIERRLARGDTSGAADLAERASRAHPDSLHLYELALTSDVALRGVVSARRRYDARIAEQESERREPAIEARLILALHLLRQSDARGALDALGGRPPAPDHPQYTLYMDKRLEAEASLGDVAAARRTVEMWLRAGGAPPELRARYAVKLSLAGVPDPERDHVSLLRASIAERDRIASPEIRAWLYRRLLAHLMASGRYDEALAAYDEGRGEVDLGAIGREDIVRARALARLQEGEAGATDVAGEIVFSLDVPGEDPSAAPGRILLVSPDASAPADADYERFVIGADAPVTLRRALTHWPVRWVLRREGTVEASGTVWPDPGHGQALAIRPLPPPSASPAAVETRRAVVPDGGVTRRPADGRRRVIGLVLDCADWRIVQYLRARDELPRLDSLIERGRRAVVYSDPPLTAAAMEALVWPERGRQASVLGWIHQVGLELGGLESVGANPAAVLASVLPQSTSLFEAVGAGPHVAANMLFSHGAIDAGHHAELIGPEGLRSTLDAGPSPRPLTPAELARMPGIAAEPRFRRQVERIGGEFLAARRVVEAEQVDLLMLRVEALDLLTHALYAELAKAGQDEGRGSLLAVYRYIDGRLGDLEAALDADDVLIVMSDHGIRTSMEHDENAIFVAVGEGIEPGRSPGRPSLAAIPRLLADWLHVETSWPAARWSPL